jgi:hypothetical protein
MVLQKNIFLILLVIITSISCTKKIFITESISVRPYDSYQLEYSVTAFGNNESIAYENAIKSVFENIFYIGSPQTINSLPMIENKSLDKKYLENFINSGKYSPFISSVSRKYSQRKEGIQKSKVIDATVVVNIESLRRYLQNDGATKKFGF